MKKFYATYTIAFLFLSILWIFFFLLKADFLAVPITVHPMEAAWSKYIGLAYYPFLIHFLFPAGIVLLSCGVGLLTVRKVKTLSLTLIDLSIIAGSMGFGIVTNFIFSVYLINEPLPLLYWILICIASFILGTLIILWKKNYSYLKEHPKEKAGLRFTQRFPYALFTVSLVFATIWLTLAIVSTPITIEYDDLVFFCKIFFVLYSLIVWPLALFIDIRDKFISVPVVRILYTSVLSLPGAGITLLVGIFIIGTFLELGFKGKNLSETYTKTIEEYKREYEERERTEREAREAEYLACRAEYFAKMEVARASVRLVDEDYKPVIREFSFDFLWNDPETETDSVTSAISFALTQRPDLLMNELSYSEHITKENYLEDRIYYYNKEKGYASWQRFRNYLVYHFPVKNMADIAFRYINYLPTLLPEEDFRNSDFEQILLTYMLTYQELYYSQDNFGAFGLVYDIVSTPLQTEERYSIYEINAIYYDRIVPYLHTTEVCDPEDVFAKNDLSKKYSFWARRYNEGTHRDLYYIMKKIWKLYN